MMRRSKCRNFFLLVSLSATEHKFENCWQILSFKDFLEPAELKH